MDNVNNLNESSGFDKSKRSSNNQHTQGISSGELESLKIRLNDLRDEFHVKTYEIDQWLKDFLDESDLDKLKREMLDKIRNLNKSNAS